MKYVLILLLLAGCSSEKIEIRRKTDYKCVTNNDKNALANFIIRCSEAANPKSDEEGEDLVAQCERTGIRTICPAAEVCQKITYTGAFLSSPIYGDYVPCEGKNE